MVLIGLSGAAWAQQTTPAGKPDQTTFDLSKGEVTLDISRTEIDAMPEYQRDDDGWFAG